MRTFEKVRDHFCKTNKDGMIYSIIFEKMKELQQDVFNFTNEDLDVLLFSFKSISANSLNKYLKFTKDIISVTMPQKEVAPSHNIVKYIDIEKLKKKTITFPYEYQAIKNQITIVKGRQEYNIRDKVVFCLVCQGVASRDLKNIKIEDVKFKIKNGETKCIINLPITKTTIVINDSELANDIARCIQEKEYLWTDGKGREILYRLRTTPYLIRPVAIRKGDSQTVSNIGQLFQTIMKKIIMPNIDTEHLSIEDIRRSLIIYWLGVLNRNIIDIQNTLNKKYNSDLYWLKDIAKEFYKDIKAKNNDAA